MSKMEVLLRRLEDPLSKMEVPLSRLEAHLSKMEAPLGRLKPPAEVFLRVGGTEEEMMGRGENLWKVKRQQRLLLLLLFHTQFLRMFSSLSQAW